MLAQRRYRIFPRTVLMRWRVRAAPCHAAQERHAAAQKEV